MPRSRKSPKNDAQSKVNSTGKYFLDGDARWGGFINVKLDDEQKERFVLWRDSSPSEGFVLFNSIVDEGMRCTLTYDGTNESYTCSFTGKLVSNSNERYCVTSRAGTMYDVMALAAWKHSILLEGSYDNLYSNGRQADWG